MPLPDQFIQELKIRSDITEVISGYVNLKKSGRNYSGLCPFHNEKTPSFYVYTESNSFYCFGCHAGGDVITFIRTIENLDYMEAVRFLAERAGMQVPESGYDNSMHQMKGRLLELNRETARFYYSVLMSETGKPGLQYLQKRGLSAATIRRFGLGYSPPSRFALVDHLKQKGFSYQEMIQANAAFESRSGRVMDRFAGRVMYPIIDLRGNVIAFGGRTLGDDKPKYLNTSDTPVFRKSENLFAFNFARNAREGYLILAEGYMDVIALHQAGFTNAVATLGTSLTQEQCSLMARYVKEVVISYDMDEAGRKASRRAMQMLRSAGLTVRVLQMDEGKDPDEYLRTHGEDGIVRFRKMLEESKNDILYQLNEIRNQEDLLTPEGRVDYASRAAQILSELDNSVEREIYAGQLADEIGVDRSSILVQINRIRRDRYKKQRKKDFRQYQQFVTGVRDTVNPQKYQNLSAANAEEGIIAFLFQGPAQQETRYLREHIPEELFCTDFNRRVYSVLMKHLEETGSCDLMDISSAFSVPEVSSISRMIAKYGDMRIGLQDIEEYRKILEREQLREKAQDCALQNDTKDIETYLQTLKEQKK